MIDVAWSIELIYPAAVWYGSVTSNTREAYEALDWRDERPKPTWDALVAAWNDYVSQSQ